MAKKVDSMDKINDTTLHELLMMMDARLKHIEDISADNRAIIVKLVKQGNSIVNFLKNIEIEAAKDIEVEYEPITDLNLDFLTNENKSLYGELSLFSEKILKQNI